ncbi:MAG: AAA family ATPase [Planctomycetes bacterium]|nr:AAA family ATPase [Planctomycetota bacterium]
MIDLHRGLLIKIFIDVAGSERRWQRADFELARALLGHVWGVDVPEKQLLTALRNVAAHSKSLKWETLVQPFAQMPPLAEHQAELITIVTRIANLVAKADGTVHLKEERALKAIQKSVESVLHKGEKAKSSPRQRKRFDKDARKIGQLVQVQHEQKDHGKSEPAADSGTTEPEQRPREEVFAEAMGELEVLIGLDTVKEDVRELVDFLKIQEERKKHDLALAEVSLHTVFRGNPGTGKTTVARILARIFGGMGILEKGHTVETDRSGLVAEYAGQTGPKTNQRIDDALDGVLFVDEAYSLVAEQGDDPFGAEAIQALLKRMEDDRDRLIVVLAGYPKPMDRMLKSNPGLSSRFQRTFDFPDYTADELLQIFGLMCEKNHYVMPQPTRENLRGGFQFRIDRSDEHFGNGRLARNVFEQAIRNLASRIVKIAPVTRELLTTLQPEDIQIDGFSR